MASVRDFPLLSIREARAWQDARRDRVVTRADRGFLPATVAGVDVSVRHDHAIAAIVVMRYPGCEPVEEVTAVCPVEFPYVPGYLAFREMPVIVDAWRRLRAVPDLLLVDGHGRAHPRRFGIACQLGLHVGVPSIGCGKTRFVGSHREPGRRRGCRVRVVDRVVDPSADTLVDTVADGSTEVIGSYVRTRDGVKPVYVSIGHRIDLGTAVRVVLRCAKYRLPEPIRRADHVAGAVALTGR